MACKRRVLDGTEIVIISDIKLAYLKSSIVDKLFIWSIIRFRASSF